MIPPTSFVGVLHRYLVRCCDGSSKRASSLEAVAKLVEERFQAGPANQ